MRPGSPAGSADGCGACVGNRSRRDVGAVVRSRRPGRARRRCHSASARGVRDAVAPSRPCPLGLTFVGTLPPRHRPTRHQMLSRRARRTGTTAAVRCDLPHRCKQRRRWYELGSVGRKPGLVAPSRRGCVRTAARRYEGHRHRHRRHPSDRRAPPSRPGVPGFAGPDGRTGCRPRPRRRRHAAGPRRGTRPSWPSGCRDGRPSGGRPAAGRPRAATGRCPPRRRRPAGTGARRPTPSRTTDTLLMPVPPSGGSPGPGRGSATARASRSSSTARRSPAAIDRRAGAPGRASRSSHAA